MIQVPFLKSQDIPKVLVTFPKENCQRIPKFIEVTQKYINSTEITEQLDSDIKVERKAYLFKSIVDNDDFNFSEKTILEQRLSLGPNWAQCCLNYLPDNIAIFSEKNNISTCHVVDNLIANYFQGKNVKCNLYGLGLIDSKIIYLQQLLIFEIVHFINNYPRKYDQNFDVRCFLKPDITPLQIPFS